MRKLILAGAIAATGLLVTASADAALLNILGGTALIVPANNDVVRPVPPAANVGAFITAQGDTVYDGALLETTANNITLTYFYVGKEAGFVNTLVTPGGSQANDPRVPTVPGDTFSTVAQAVAGLLDFQFEIDNLNTGLSPDFVITNTKGGANGNQAFGNDGPNSPFRSFALAYLDANYAITGTATNRVGIFLDDSGAGPDDNHDDWVGYVEAVPVPAAIPLFLSGLAGIGLISRRRARRA